MSCMSHCGTHDGDTSALARHHDAIVRVLREAALIIGLLVTYDAARLLRAHGSSLAFDNADRLLDVERWLHLPREQSVQSALLAFEPLTRAANAYYASVHFPLTGLVLLWLFVFRAEFYPRIRTAIIAATAVALVMYLLIPVAPPRMLTSRGFLDTGVMLGQSVYGNGGTTFANQFAAMPSLHVGWAVLVAIACITASRTRWRWLWIAHPVITLFVVVGTGNHYWLDGLAGTALVVTAYVLAGAVHRPSVAESSRTTGSELEALVNR